jgi:predicted Zn-dependent protease
MGDGRGVVLRALEAGGWFDVKWKENGEGGGVLAVSGMTDTECLADWLHRELEQKGVRVLPGWDPRTVRVKRVMARLVPFSGMVDEDWEVFVVNDDSTANAFVLPGGKVFVFSGILGIARNDSGLATVLGHEIAHNLADHHSERLSQDVGASIVLYSLVILGGVFGLGPLIMHFFGGRFLDVAFGFPMSRLQESEADYIGLMMMAEACYDPQEAASFWARMERASGQEVPEWMSTHPTVGLPRSELLVCC